MRGSRPHTHTHTHTPTLSQTFELAASQGTDIALLRASVQQGISPTVLISKQWSGLPDKRDRIPPLTHFGQTYKQVQTRGRLSGCQTTVNHTHCPSRGPSCSIHTPQLNNSRTCLLTWFINKHCAHTSPPSAAECQRCQR